MPVELPTGTVTLLFTDIEGSTRMLQELGREPYLRALTDHRRLLRDTFAGHGGVEVEMQGDSFHFAFRTAHEAVEAALAAQDALHRHQWDSEPVKVRIGVHSGEPLQADGLYAGIDVHEAARVMSAAHGGQVLVSERTATLLDEDRDNRIVLRDLGAHRLKDIPEPRRLFQASAPGATAEFPPLQTLHVSNLPLPAERLIGRREELRSVASRFVAGDARLLTLTGPGGTGKTRLALEVAAELVDRFAGGVHFVALASIHDPELLLSTVAQALGLREQPGEPLSTLVPDRLSARPTLLVLDNFEQIVAAAPTVSSLLAAAANAHVLVTSREPLHVAGEHVFAVPPLHDADAVELFGKRAAAASDTFSLDRGTAAVAATICARVDCLPLAIELAAARVSVLSPEAIVERLDHSLDLLTAGRRDADERHKTLRSTIAWSYDLLDVAEQQALTRLAVFPAGFSVDAAADVCQAGLDELTALADQSLLGREPASGGEPRFRLLRVIREYMLDRLEARGEADEVARVHAQWCLESFAGGVATNEASLERAWLQRHDLRAAIEWARREGKFELALEIAITLVEVLSIRGSLTEARQVLDVLLDEATEIPQALRARALHEAAGIALRQGDTAGNRRLSEAALRLASEMDDPQATVRAFAKLAIAALADGDLEAASRCADEATLNAERADDVRARVNALNVRGTVELALQKYREALGSFNQALELVTTEALEARRDTIAGLHYNIAIAALLSGDDALSERMLETTLEECRALADLEGTAYCFVLKAVQQEGEGALLEAAASLAASQRLLAESGAALEPVERSLADAVAAAIDAALSPTELERAAGLGAELAEAEIQA